MQDVALVSMERTAMLDVRTATSIHVSHNRSSPHAVDLALIEGKFARHAILAVSSSVMR